MKSKKNKQKLPSLREERVNKGYTLVQLGKLVGVRYTTLSNYESGVSVPSDEVFRRLQLVLHLPGEYNDYFSHRKAVGRKKLFGENAVCQRKGCQRHPVAKGMCMSHYVIAWRSERSKEKDRLLHAAWEKLLEYEQKEKKEKS